MSEHSTEIPIQVQALHELVVIRQPELEDEQGIYITDDEWRECVYFATPGRRSQWLLGRIALKRALQRFFYTRYAEMYDYRDFVIERDAYGKPFVAGWSHMIDISISHSREVAAAVVADTTAYRGIGVDIEHIRPISEAVCSAFLAPQERFALSRMSPRERTTASLCYWSLKEAYLKALGLGLRVHPKNVIVQWASDTSTYTTTSMYGDAEATIYRPDDSTIIAISQLHNNDNRRTNS